jgi:hypothetical protein
MPRKQETKTAVLTMVKVQNYQFNYGTGANDIVRTSKIQPDVVC